MYLDIVPKVATTTPHTLTRMRHPPMTCTVKLQHMPRKPTATYLGSSPGIPKCPFNGGPLARISWPKVERGLGLWEIPSREGRGVESSTRKPNLSPIALPTEVPNLIGPLNPGPQESEAPKISKEFRKSPNSTWIAKPTGLQRVLQ